jgi:hypothetical protein
MRIIVAIIFILAAWKWSNWRNWREYYPTILFTIVVILVVDLITANHKLWILTNSPFITSTIANSSFTTFLILPAKVLLYLSKFPQKFSHQFYYILIWVSIFSLMEFGMTHLGLFNYANGWSLSWSILHNCVMFPILRIHYYCNPLLAWLLSGVFLLFIWYFFGFTIEMLG